MKRLLLAIVMLVLSSFAMAAININTASKEELDALPGVGPVKAQAIVDYRKANGPFKSVDDLKNVKGIGDATFDKLKSDISVSGSSKSSPKAAAAAAPAAVAAPTAAKVEPAKVAAPAPAAATASAKAEPAKVAAPVAIPAKAEPAKMAAPAAAPVPPKAEPMKAAAAAPTRADDKAGKDKSTAKAKDESPKK